MANEKRNKPPRTGTGMHVVSRLSYKDMHAAIFADDTRHPPDTLTSTILM